MAQSLEVAQLYASLNVRGLDKAAVDMNKFKSHFLSLRGVLTTFAGVFTLKKVASEFLGAARAMEDYRVSVRAVSDTVANADATFARIRRWAVINPIDTDEAIAAFVRMKTAAITNSEQAVLAVGDLSAVMQADMRDIANALVTTEVKALRRLGIILDRTGAMAKIRFGSVTKEVGKDIQEVRQGILSVINEAVGGTMVKTQDTFSGTLKTMTGMWTDFSANVMEGGSGPFSFIKNELHEMRDSWAAFTPSTDYQTLIQQLQVGLLLALKGVVGVVKTLTATLQLAYKWANLLGGALAAFASYKITAAIGSMASKLHLLVPAIGALISGPAGLIALAAAAVVGVTAFSGISKAMKEAKAQTELLANTVQDVNDKFAHAPRNMVVEQLRTTYNTMGETASRITALKRQMVDLQDTGATMHDFFGRKKLSDEISRINTEITRLSGILKITEEQKKALLEIISVTPIIEPIIEPEVDEGGSKGPTAAEKLVAGMRDKMKYLFTAGSSFTGVLEQWIKKFKVLSDDWKVIRDMQLEINDAAAKNAAEETVQALVGVKESLFATSTKSVKDLMTASDEASAAALRMEKSIWMKDQGFITAAENLDTLRAEFENLRIQAEKTGASMSNVLDWTPEMQVAYEKWSGATRDLVNDDLTSLKAQYENGTLSVGQYKTALQQLMETYGQFPSAAALIQAAMQTTNATTLTFAGAMQAAALDAKKAYDELGGSIGTGLVDAFAKAIAYGDDFGEMLKALGKEIIYTVLKATILQSVLGALGIGGGGSVSDWHDAGNAVPRMHSGGIVGNDEQLTILKKGEGVFTPQQMHALGSNLGNASPVAITSNINITNNGSGDMDEAQAQALGKQVKATIKTQVAETLYEYSRSGLLRGSFAR